MKRVKVVSLFSGIGGFETGFFQALGKDKVDIVFSSEIDKYAKQAYEIIYNHPPHGDITKIHEKDIPDHDILVGGFPCQAFSSAGKRLGFEDTRGTLFFEIARIAKEKQPKMMILENVKGLLTHDKGKTFEVIMKTLGELDYKVDFQVLNSKFHGVAQNRERVYIVAVKHVKEEAWNIENLKGAVLRAKEKFTHYKEIQSFNFSFPVEKEVTVRLKDILEKEVENHFFLEKTKEEKILAKIKGREMEEQVFRIDDKRGGNAIHSWDLEIKGQISDEEKRALTQMILERRKGEKDGNPISPKQVGSTVKVFDRLAALGYVKKVGNKYDFNFGNLSFDISKVIPPNGISPTVTCTDSVKYGVLIQEEIGLDFVAGVTDKPNWLDNGKELSRNFKQGSRIYNANGIASTLSAQGVGGLGGHSGLYLIPEWRIRRLTPLECFRLQGFPDEYVHKLKEAGLSNSRLYKMAGNAVTTNVVSRIVKEAQVFL